MNEFLLAFLILLQYADGYTTYKILGNGGRELNPILAKAFDHFGVLPSLVVIKAMCVGLGVWLYLSQQTEILAVLCALYVAVVGNNYRQMNK